MRGLSKHTEEIFEQISKLECIKNYTLIGGTALALQLGHRLSEDAALMLHRNSHRDYYDIYSILQSGVSLKDIVYGAANYTGHRLKTKNIIAMLVDSEHVGIDKRFQELNPVYDFDLSFLEKKISEKIKEMAEHNLDEN